MKFRKKPVVIDAIQWTGDNLQEIKDFGASVMTTRLATLNELIITTLEDGSFSQAIHVASPGDWIIKGVVNEFYPCKDSIFKITYEPV